MHTITIQIGNTDQKLSQKEWAKFTLDLQYIAQTNGQIHFYGCSPSDSCWQNCCVVVNPFNITCQLDIIKELIELKKKYKQDAIALTTGTTRMI